MRRRIFRGWVSCRMCRGAVASFDILLEHGFWIKDVRVCDSCDQLWPVSSSGIR